MALVTSFRGAAMAYDLALSGGSNGVGDIGHATKLTTFPHPDGTFTGIGPRYGAPLYPGQSGVTSAKNDFAVGNFADKKPTISVVLGADKFDATANGNFSTYSCSILFKINGWLADNNKNVRILEFLNAAGARVWSVAIGGYTLISESQYQGNKVRLLNSTGGLVNGGANTLSANTWHKLEIQAQETGTKLTCRIYRFNSTTNVWSLVATRSGSPSHSIAAATAKIGFIDALPALNVFDMNFANFNVWDTYDADGQFPAWDMPAPALKYSVWDGTTEVPATPKVWDGTTEVDVPLTALQYQYGQFSRFEIAPATRVNGTLTTYSAGDPNCQYRAFLPDGSPPAGGWPVLLWCKTNYFLTGGANDVISDHQEMVAHAIAHGWGVIGVGVTPSQLGGGDPAKAWPRQILDFKLAAKHVIANASTLGINPARIVAAGQSSGAYNALAAVLSTNATDIHGQDLTIAGGDPEFLGCLVFQAPVNLSRMWTVDPGHPYHDNIGGTQGAGAIRACLNSMLGLPSDTATNPLTAAHDLDKWLTEIDPADVPPIRYHYSSTDGVVGAFNHVDLAAVLGPSSIDYGETHDGRLSHEFTSRRFQPTWKEWLSSL